MHEHGLTDRLLAAARREAERQGGRLVGLRVRIGALGPDPERLAAEFAHLQTHHDLSEIVLQIEHAPEDPSGLTLLSVSLSREETP